jgi:outer membrane protein insertion porin family
MSVLRGLLIAVAMGGVSIASSIPVVLMPQPAAAQGVETIVVEGNRRVEAETVRSYFRPGPGGRLDQSALDDGLKALIGTGLFQDVKISQSGGRLVVSVVE